MTTIDAIAEWAHGLDGAAVPADVVDRCRAQRRSVLGGIAASVVDDSSGRVVEAVAAWASDGPAPLVTTDRHVSVEDALYAASALSVALDFDDYVCFGHTGHSAVLTPLLLAAETGSDGGEQLLAQVVANEIEARLGGAALLGPMNGQLWAFIHAAGAAVAAARLLDLDRARLAHALAIALAHPLRATVPGFMAPDSKLLVAAEPATAGLRAARLAAAGVTGPLDTLDDGRGALAALSYAPIRRVLAGLGDGWATKTLSVKPYPGCAYIDTTVDALMSLDLGQVEPDAVEAVEVDAGLLTCGMDHLSAPYAAIDPPSPITVTFSIPWNVAIVLRAGRLTEAETTAEWLTANADDLAALRSRVTLRHDPALTARSAVAFGPLLPGAGLARELGGRRLLRGVRQVRHEHPTGLGAADLLGFLRTGRTGSAVLRAVGGRDWWDPEALDEFRVTFPARVTVRFRDGDVRHAEAYVPRGGAGNAQAGPDEVARDKLRRSGPRLWEESGTVAIDEAIERDDPKLFALLGGAPTS